MPGAFFGEGLKSSFQYNVECIGNEREILNCASSLSNCTHAQDAGVRCSQGYYSLTNTLKVYS